MSSVVELAISYIPQKTVEIRYIVNRDEQLKILQACHADPTSGHLGFRRTLARITERFLWKGVVKDSQDIVSIYIIIHVQI